MNALERWRSRPLQVRALTRCDECGELKEDAKKRVNYCSNMTVVCCAKCTAEMTEFYEAERVRKLRFPINVGGRTSADRASTDVMESEHVPDWLSDQ
ncbi:hypothetical protein OKW32_005290 [Paraburkholderia youngii]